MKWLLVRSLKSSHKEALCEDYSDLTSPTSNQIPEIHISVSVGYVTLKKFFFSACVFILFYPSFDLRNKIEFTSPSKSEKIHSLWPCLPLFVMAFHNVKS